MMVSSHGDNFTASLLLQITRQINTVSGHDALESAINIIVDAFSASQADFLIHDDGVFHCLFSTTNTRQAIHTKLPESILHNIINNKQYYVDCSTCAVESPYKQVLAITISGANHLSGVVLIAASGKFKQLPEKQEVLNLVSPQLVRLFSEYEVTITVNRSESQSQQSENHYHSLKLNELFSHIIDQLPVILFRINHAGIITDIRGNGLQRMGVSDMDWAGKPVYGLFVGMEEYINAALAGKTSLFESKGRFNSETWWFYTSLIHDSWSADDGYYTSGAVGFSVDITEQKLNENVLVDLLQQNRELAKHMIEIQEVERTALSRELHDELGQSITAVKSLAVAILTSAGSQYSEIRSLSNSIVDLSDQLYQTTSQIMHRLRPEALDELGVIAAIHSCVKRSELELTGVNCTVETEGDLDEMPDIVKVTLYRIVQESLTNISKYAMASNVRIEIIRETKEGKDRRKGNLINGERHAIVYKNKQGEPVARRFIRDKLKIHIKDDGVGMDIISDTRKVQGKSRRGLQGIRERLNAIRGNLHIESQKNKGVSIKVEIDLGTKIIENKLDINTAVEVGEI